MFYIVATPIGNLKEITFRAIETLKSAHLILAEDTRHTAILLNEYEIKTRCESYQKFNERAKTDYVINLLQQGKDVALVSDAGTPLISDPGSILLSEIISCNLPYTVISGPCAAISAVVMSGFDLRHFCFVGFLPEKNSERVEVIDKFRELDCTLIFYVSPHSVKKDVEFLFEKLGARQCALVREISKVHEQVVRFKLGESVDCPIKGEMVLIIKGEARVNQLNSLSVKSHVEHYINLGFSKMDAVKKTATDRGVAKNIIYKEVNF